jgi:hypothetical protein
LLQIKIVHFSSQNLVYVHNLEKEQQEMTHRLEQNIAKYALNSIYIFIIYYYLNILIILFLILKLIYISEKLLPEFPVVGQIIMAHYKVDNNYYRAIVTKVKENMILVKYIDYGNEEITTLDRLFVLSDDLKEVSSLKYNH